MTIANDITTPGNSLQNLKYQFKHPKALLMLLQVFFPYILTRLNEVMQRGNWNDNRKTGARDRLKFVMYKVVQLLQNVFKVA